nr:CCA tRNA nucleotidyltransferase [uncultured Campylobacter sp.]
MSKIGSKICKNKNLKWLRDFLAPHTKRAYIVGGCVRDAMLGKKISDFDVEIYGIDPAKFDALMAQIGACGVGKNYFVYKFKNFDLSLPRTENKTGEGHKAFEVAYTDDERAASLRRDFTVNAMMINIFDGSFLDFYGGESDLRRGILRHIDDEKFAEDSLRVLRAVQFSARLNFRIARESLGLMKRLSISDLSRERINGELMKLFGAKFQEVGFLYLYKLELLGKIFGLNLSRVEAEKFATKLKSAVKFLPKQNSKKDECEFLYLLNGYFGIKNFYDLGLPKSFEACVKELFFVGRPSDKDLLKIALDKPLKSWLGLNSPSLIKRAKNLGVYEAKFEPAIDTAEILKQGFKGAAIGAEIRHRQDLAIDKFLNEKSSSAKN